jgi:hypothetical protein
MRSVGMLRDLSTGNLSLMRGAVPPLDFFAVIFVRGMTTSLWMGRCLNEVVDNCGRDKNFNHCVPNKDTRY